MENDEERFSTEYGGFMYSSFSHCLDEELSSERLMWQIPYDKSVADLEFKLRSI